MLVVLAILAALALGVVGGVIFERKRNRLPALPPLDTLALLPRPERRFRVVYSTERGAIARQILERATPREGDLVELFDYRNKRGAKDG